MSAVKANDLSALQQLARRFEAAAEEFPAVDAIVIYRPDKQREEFEREAARIFDRDPGSDNWDDGHGRYGRGALGAQRAAFDWERWIPPGCYLRTDQHGGEIWRHAVHGHDGTGYAHVWQLHLVGTHLNVLPDPRPLRWEMLTYEAVNHILGVSGRGDTPEASWLIHLADREEPLRPRPWEPPTEFRRDQRRIVDYDLFHGRPVWGRSASQPDKNGGRRLHPWWAVRLTNVFWESALAVRHAIENCGRAPVEPPSPPEPVLPRWDARAKELWLGDAKIVSYSRHAPAQFSILEAFQKAGWSQTVEAPRRLTSLKDAVDALNEKVANTRLRFYRREYDKVLEWRLLTV